MKRSTTSHIRAFGIFASLAPALGACGTHSLGETADAATGGFDAGPGDAKATPADASEKQDAGGDGGIVVTPASPIASISITPATFTLTSTNGALAKEPYSIVAKYVNGTTATLPAGTSGISWSADAAPLGSISSAGSFSANGSLGGLVHITASYQGQTATAALTVKLLITATVPGVPAGATTALPGASTQDPSVAWAYPYDGTVWPRGVLPPVLQWNGGAASDYYYVHITSPTFELQQFVAPTGAPSSQFAIDPTTWAKFTESTVGVAQISINRWNGTAATKVATHTWTVAGASMHGTIYYWSNNLGRVLRIKPGAKTPDDFANQAPLNDPTKFTQSSCLMTCHTVSADGSTLVSGGGAFGGSYNLLTDQPTYSLGGTWGPTGGGASSSSVVKWSTPALSPDGKYMLTSSNAEALAYVNDNATKGFLGMFTTADGLPVPTSGMMGVPVAEPAWSPEGSKIVYVDRGDPITTPWYTAWNDPPPGDLKVVQFDATKNPMTSAPTTIVATGADANKRIAWPTVSPDGKWALYSRSAGVDTRTIVPGSTAASGPSDLYIASTVTPNQEIRLASLDGDSYPFAAGARDLSWNFEPSFAPVAAGGYFWVVFTSRRTYGNTITGVPEATTTPAAPGVKQLWVAAIDQNPTPGKDPSHAAFHLSGQDEANLAMRGFWALPPCASAGQSCQSGTECCGGYCGAGDGGALACMSAPPACSNNGDKCNKTSDCCGASSGVTCIAHVCSEPTPQ